MLGFNRLAIKLSSSLKNSGLAIFIVLVVLISSTGIANSACSDAPDKLGSNYLVNSYTDSHQREPKVAKLSNGGFIAVWLSQINSQLKSSLQVRGQLYDSNRAQVGTELIINEFGNSDKPAVAALNDGRFVVVWSGASSAGDNTGIHAKIYNADGTVSVSNFQVNTFEPHSQSDPVITALSNGGFVVIWQSYGQDADIGSIHGQMYSANAARVGSEFQVNDHETNRQWRPAVSGLTAGGFVVVWQSEFQYGRIYQSAHYKMYDNAGAVTKLETRVTTFNHTTSNAAVAGLSDGGFVITWFNDGERYDSRDGSFSGIFGRRFDASGNALGNDDFQVNTYTWSAQYNPAVAAFPNGGFIVTWEGPTLADTVNLDISGRVFDKNGNPNGDDFRINTYTQYGQEASSVATLDNGRFVVLWHGSGDSGGAPGYHDVYGQVLKVQSLYCLDPDYVDKSRECTTDKDCVRISEAAPYCSSDYTCYNSMPRFEGQQSYMLDLNNSDKLTGSLTITDDDKPDTVFLYVADVQDVNNNSGLSKKQLRTLISPAIVPSLISSSKTSSAYNWTLDMAGVAISDEVKLIYTLEARDKNNGSATYQVDFTIKPKSNLISWSNIQIDSKSIDESNTQENPLNIDSSNPVISASIAIPNYDASKDELWLRAFYVNDDGSTPFAANMWLSYGADGTISTNFDSNGTGVYNNFAPGLYFFDFYHPNRTPLTSPRYYFEIKSIRPPTEQMSWYNIQIDTKSIDESYTQNNPLIVDSSNPVISASITIPNYDASKDEVWLRVFSVNDDGSTPFAANMWLSYGSDGTISTNFDSNGTGVYNNFTPGLYFFDFYHPNRTPLTSPRYYFEVK